MKKNGSILILFIISAVLLAAGRPAKAVVTQNATTAIRSDNFIGNASQSTAKTNKAQQENSNKETREDNFNPEDIRKHYTSRLFSTFSGYITIEQDNLPSKIAVSQGSEIQLNLREEAGHEWFADTDETVVEIKSNKTVNNQHIIVLKAVGKGKARLLLDYLSTVKPEYKLILSKRMLIMVK